MLTRATNERMRTIITEVPGGMEVKIENGVVSSDHLHLLVVIPPGIAVSDFVRRTEARISRAKENILGEAFLGKGYFGATSGHITDKVTNEYINKIYRYPSASLLYLAQDWSSFSFLPLFQRNLQLSASKDSS